MTTIDAPTFCNQLTAAINDDRSPIVYIDRYREIGIRDLDDPDVFTVIEYCPFCGNLLPASLREAWFEQLDKLGLEPEDISPSESLGTDRWWRIEG